MKVVKATDLKNPPVGHETPEARRQQTSVILQDRIESDLCQMRSDMQATVPLLQQMVQQNATAIEAILKLTDRIVEMMAHNETLLEAANKNTDRIVEAVKPADPVSPFHGA